MSERALRRCDMKRLKRELSTVRNNRAVVTGIYQHNSAVVILACHMFVLNRCLVSSAL